MDEVIKIKDLSVVSINSVEKAIVPVDVGNDSEYFGIDLKEINTAIVVDDNITIVPSIEILDSNDTIVYVKVYNRSVLLKLVELDEFTVNHSASNFDVDITTFDQGTNKLTVISSNNTNTQIPFTVNVTYKGIQYSKSLVYLNKIENDTYTLDVEAGSLLADGTKETLITYYKNGVPIDLLTSDLNYTPTFFTVTTRSETVNSIKRVAISAVIKTEYSTLDKVENVTFKHKDSALIKDTVQLQYNAADIINLSFSKSPQSYESQVLYFTINGEYQNISLSVLQISLVNTSAGTVVVDSDIVDGHVCATIDLTLTQATTLQASYKYNGTTYTDTIGVTPVTVAKYSLNITPNVTDIDFSSPLIVKATLTNDTTGAAVNLENTSIAIDFPNATFAQEIDVIGTVSTLVITTTALSITSKCRITVTYGGISYTKQLNVTVVKPDEYSISALYTTQQYSGTPLVNEFIFYKNGNPFDYDSTKVNISGTTGPLALDHKLKDDYTLTTTIDSTVNDFQYNVQYLVGGVVVAQRPVTINVFIASERYELRCVEPSINLNDDNNHEMYASVYLHHPTETVDISQFPIVVNIKDSSNSFTYSSSASQAYPNYKRIKFLGVLMLESIAIQTLVEFSITYAGKVYSTGDVLLTLTVAPSYKLSIRPERLDLLVDANSTVILEKPYLYNSVVIALYDGNTAVKITQDNLTELLHNNTTNLDYTVEQSDTNLKVTYLKHPKSLIPLNVLATLTYLGVEYTERYIMTAAQRSTDTWDIKCGVSSVSLAAIDGLSFDNCRNKYVDLKFIVSKNGETSYEPSELSTGIFKVVANLSTPIISTDGIRTMRVSDLSGSSPTGTLELVAGNYTHTIDLVACNKIALGGDLYKSSSTSTVTIGTGDKAFTVGDNYAYSKALPIIVAYDATNYMTGIVKSYTGGVVTVTVDTVVGSGEYSDWELNIQGASGPQGSDGLDGTDGKSVVVDLTTYTDKVGFKLEGDPTFAYTDSLKGASGDGIEYIIDGDRVGIRTEGTTPYDYTTNLTGADGEAIELRKDTSDNLQWSVAGADTWTTLYTKAELKGTGLEYDVDGDRIGVRAEGESTYTYTDSLTGADGSAGSIYVGTSTTSLTISVGEKTLTTQAGLGYVVGQSVFLSYDATRKMYGYVQSYSGTTMVVNIHRIGGEGTYSVWNLNISGPDGVDGVDGTDGTDGSDGTDGLSFQLLGSDTVSNILAKDGTAGDVWIATDTNLGYSEGYGLKSDGGGTGALHWTSIGRLKGDTGPAGEDGIQGEDGIKGDTGDSTTLIGTSSTSINLSSLSYSATAGTTITFTLDAAADFVVGQVVQIIYNANNYTFGRITNKSGLNITALIRGTVGGGTYSNWTIIPSGEPTASINTTTTTTLVKNYSLSKIDANGVLSIDANYMINSIIVEKIDGTPLLKLGSVIAGQNILSEQVISDIVPPLVDNNSFIPILDANWNLYYSISGGGVDVYINTIKIK